MRHVKPISLAPKLAQVSNLEALKDFVVSASQTLADFAVASLEDLTNVILGKRGFGPNGDE